MHHQQAVEFRVDHIESCVTPRCMRCTCDLSPKMSSFPSSSIVGHGRDSRMGLDIIIGVASYLRLVFRVEVKFLYVL